MRVRLDRLLWVRALPETTPHNHDIVQFLDIAFAGRPVDGSAPFVADDESDAVGWFSISRLPPLLERHSRLIQIACHSDSRVPVFGQQERALS